MFGQNEPIVTNGKSFTYVHTYIHTHVHACTYEISGMLWPPDFGYPYALSVRLMSMYGPAPHMHQSLLHKHIKTTVSTLAPLVPAPSARPMSPESAAT